MLEFLRRFLIQRRSKATAPDAASEAKPLDRRDTAERIEVLAKGGFKSEASALAAIVEEYLVPDDLDANDRLWVEEEVERVFARKRAEESTWPHSTDFDRLSAAFAKLDADGIISLHCAGYTRSDGISDAWEAYHRRLEDGSKARGYVFYHGQDVESAVAHRGLYLAFGAFDERDETAKRIAETAVSVLGAQGLQTQWEGSVDIRILVWPMGWQKRSPEI